MLSKFVVSEIESKPPLWMTKLDPLVRGVTQYRVVLVLRWNIIRRSLNLMVTSFLKLIDIRRFPARKVLHQEASTQKDLVLGVCQAIVAPILLPRHGN